MQVERWATTLVAANFDFAPTDNADASAEGFGDGFFRGEAGSEAMGLVVAVGAFAGGEEAVEEAFPQPFDTLLDADNFDAVDTTAKHNSPEKAAPYNENTSLIIAWGMWNDSQRAGD